MEKSDKQITIKIVNTVEEIGQTVWDELANPIVSNRSDNTYNPFNSYTYFYALEKSQSASKEAGWFGQHLIMEESRNEFGSEIIGILPCYLKNHSQGEYVFDHGWAHAFENAGGNYYPKLQASVPFTPASGNRLLVGAGVDTKKRRLLFAGGLQEVCDQLGVSSAHITFLEKQEWEILGEAGYLQRTDQQFHWLNNDYTCFDDFLNALSSRKRKNIRKERKAALQDNGLTIEWLTGSQLTEEVWDVFYQFYTDTGMRKWGQPYLTRQFYSLIGETMAEDILLILVKRQGKYIAGAINFIGSHTLYGRHWGALEDHPYLHFEVCYYQAIEYAIQHKLDRIEAGAQGGHKLARGYMPQTTYSAHYISQPDFRRAVENFLEQERLMVERENLILATHGPFKKGNTQ